MHTNAVQIGSQHVVGPTKGREARSAPVPEFVLNELSVQCKGEAADDPVFTNRYGMYLQRPKSSDRWLTLAAKAAGVQQVTPHDLRHTCASLAVSAGVNVLAMARMLGHKDPSVTLRVYADLFDTDLDVVAESLHARYSPGKFAQNVSTKAGSGKQNTLWPAQKVVRAEGLEPSSSFEHGHLKPARLPISPRPHAERSYRRNRARNLSVPRPSLSSNARRVHEIRGGIRSCAAPHRGRPERLRNRTTDRHSTTHGGGLAAAATNSSKELQGLVGPRYRS